jgi:NADPH-dependent curcumin reductase CurA
MTQTMSREIRLASRRSGIPTAANFTLARVELEPLQDQQVLVRDWLDRQGEFEKEVGGCLRAISPQRLREIVI